ncbi:ABC transporter permease [Reyranella sp. CPCC 100927]|uniref:ABC transporter permease n=1 Tax=Reyranella sp. CPCC 100927 TaxID=2599616 RepID=UPI0011B49EE7|nr:ABC transporter permease [Reyranella sp. CPCC 100927]TWT10686.1 tetratricopeptide repeat protein [Reyranella sp. CPCC 100927]
MSDDDEVGSNDLPANIPQDLLQLVREAIAVADRDPRNVGSLLHAAEALLAAGYGDEGIKIARRAVDLSPTMFAAQRVLSGLLGASGQYTLAIVHGQQAVDLKPDDSEVRLHLGGLLMAAGRYREAVEHLQAHCNRPGGQPQGWRLLSTALYKIGDLPASLETAQRAVDTAPDELEYRLNLASLLGEAGQYGDALSVLERAGETFGSDARLWRASSGFRVELGDLSGALKDAEQSIALSPHDEALRVHRDHVADLCNIDRMDAISRPPVVPRRRRSGPREPQRLSPPDAILARWAVIHAVMLREARTRFGRARLGYLWAIVEPIGHLLTLGVVFSALNQAPPPVGTNLFLYYVTGLLPYLMFAHVSTELMVSTRNNSSLLQLPAIRIFDAITARALLHLVTEVLVGVIIFTMAVMLGEQGLPADLLTTAAAVLCLWALATGIGISNMVISEFWTSWDTIYAAIVRLLYFASGLYYSPISMPASLREILLWNPVLQGVEWFRSGFYQSYEPHWLDIPYTLNCAIGVLLLGLLLEKAARPSLMKRAAS